MSYKVSVFAENLVTGHRFQIDGTSREDGEVFKFRTDYREQDKPQFYFMPEYWYVYIKNDATGEVLTGDEIIIHEDTVLTQYYDEADIEYIALDINIRDNSNEYGYKIIASKIAKDADKDKIYNEFMELYPQKEGYTTKYSASGARPNNNNDRVNTVFLYYALNYYDVKFVDKDGLVLNSASIGYGDLLDEISLKHPQFEVTKYKGWKFDGWEYDFSKPITGDTTIMARYIGDRSARYRVAFVDYDKTILDIQWVYIHEDAELPSPPHREGYEFKDWDKPHTDITETTILTAIYEQLIGTFTVKFIDWNNSLLKEQAVNYGENAVPPAINNREGYEFAGWSKNYNYITADSVIYALYTQKWSKSVIEVYSRAENALDLVGTIAMAMDCKITHNLNGECKIFIKTLAKYGKFIEANSMLRYKQLFFNIAEINKYTQDGLYLLEITGEHISNILNDELYNINYFAYSGSPKKCLELILSGTGFSAGTVDFNNSVTLMVNKEDTSRRDVLMQLVAICGGELEYNSTELGIRRHIGSDTPIELMDTLNVTDLSLKYTPIDNKKVYDIKLSKKTGINLGDNIHISFSQLDIDTQERISVIEYNPFNFREIVIGIGDYSEIYNDSLYKDDELRNMINDVDEKLKKAKKSFSWHLPVDEDVTDEELIEEEEEEQPTQEVTIKIESVTELPLSPDPDTIYLIQAEAAIY